MEDLIIRISAFATPSLIGVVIWFLVKKFEEGERSSFRIQKNIDNQRKEILDKISKIEDRSERNVESIRLDMNKISHLIVIIQNTMNKEVNELHRLMGEMKSNSDQVQKWLEDSKENHGKIIYMDASVQRHEQILVSSAKVMKNQNDRISKIEAEVIQLKRPKE
jgi:hypothetical protein